MLYCRVWQFYWATIPCKTILYFIPPLLPLRFWIHKEAKNQQEATNYYRTEPVSSRWVDYIAELTVGIWYNNCWRTNLGRNKVSSSSYFGASLPNKICRRFLPLSIRCSWKTLQLSSQLHDFLLFHATYSFTLGQYQRCRFAAFVSAFDNVNIFIKKWLLPNH